MQTLKVQLLALPEASTAVQVTFVQPSENRLPEGGTQVIVGDGSQLSVAVTAYFTRAPLGFAQRIKMLLGQLMTGGSRSRRTVTSKQHHCGAAPAIWFVQQTVV